MQYSIFFHKIILYWNKIVVITNKNLKFRLFYQLKIKMNKSLIIDEKCFIFIFLNHVESIIYIEYMN